MRKNIYIMLGGAAGAVLRVLVRNMELFQCTSGLPYSTLVVNFTGALILAFFLTVSFEISNFDPDIRIGFSTGFLGAFTTFSTLCKETAMLMFNGDYSSAILYIVLSCVLGFAAAYVGYILAKKVIVKLTHN